MPTLIILFITNHLSVHSWNGFKYCYLTVIICLHKDKWFQALLFYSNKNKAVCQSETLNDDNSPYKKKMCLKQQI